MLSLTLRQRSLFDQISFNTFIGIKLRQTLRV